MEYLVHLNVRQNVDRLQIREGVVAGQDEVIAGDSALRHWDDNMADAS